MVGMISLPPTMLGESEETIARFVELVESGQSPRMAEILATRSCPGAQTDTARVNDLPVLEKAVGLGYAQKIRKEAAAAGIQISDNSRYNPTMADSRGGGDPNAWIHAGDGISTWKNRLKATGGGSEDLGVKMDLSRVAEKQRKVQDRYDKKESIKQEIFRTKRDKRLKG